MITRRPATDSDLPFLDGVFLRAMQPSIAATRGFWDEAKERGQFREQLHLDGTRILLFDEIAVGFFTIVDRGQDLELHTLCIAPEFQRRGFGTEAIRQIVNDALREQRGIVLSVLKHNAGARALYERLGFSITGETTHHDRMRFPS